MDSVSTCQWNPNFQLHELHPELARLKSLQQLEKNGRGERI